MFRQVYQGTILYYVQIHINNMKKLDLVKCGRILLLSIINLFKTRQVS
jgi:hypothetical protein